MLKLALLLFFGGRHVEASAALDELDLPGLDALKDKVQLMQKVYPA